MQAPEADWWANSKTVISRTNSTVADLRSFYMLGDTVRLTPENFPHLAVDPSTALTKVEKIVIDAREVVINMPILLANGRIEIRADKVTFTPNGYFAFYGQPKQSGEGVFILARSVDTFAFSVKNYLPFNFVTANASWPAGLFRRVSISATEVVGPLGGLTPAAAREKLWSTTLDPDSALIPSGDADLAKRFELKIGSEANAAYYGAIKSKMIAWPVRFAEAARDFQFKFPFSAAAEAYLRTLVGFNRDAMQASPNSQTTAIIDNVLRRYDRKQDGLGASAYYVPRENLETLQSGLAADAGTAIDLASDWFSVYLGSATGNGLDTKLLDREAASISSANDQIGVLGDQIDSFFSQTASINQDVSALDTRISSASERLHQELDEQIKKREQAAEIKAAGTALSYAAALLPGGAAVTVGVSTLTLAGSQAIAGNQLGGANKIGNIAQLVTLITEDAKTAKENVDAVHGLQCDWRKARYLLGYAVNKDSASTDLKASGSCTDDVKRPTGNGLSEAGAALKVLGENGQKAREHFLAQLNQGSLADPSIAELAGQDTEFQALLATRQSLATKLAQIEDGREKAQELILQLGGTIASSKAQVVDALAANLDADAGRPLLGVIALGAAQESLQSIITQMGRLERAFVYHTGQIPASPSGVTLAAIQDSIRLLLDQVAAGGQAQIGSADVTDFAAIRQTIQNGLSSLRLQVKSYAADIDRQHEAFINRTGQTYQFSLPISYSKPAVVTSGNIATAKFLDAINAVIRAQVADPSVTDVIALPSQNWDGAFGKRERIIGSEVDLHFRDTRALQNRSLELRVLHPRFGKIHTLSGCQFFDFRSDLDTDQYEVFTTTCGSDGVCKPSSMLTLPSALDRENQKRTFLPLDTSYLLQVILRGAQSSTVIPVVDSVTVTTSILR